MDGAAPGSTQDWLLPEHVRPPLIGELELKIEEALVTARASEAAVMTVGAAALDAAEQARRAAELAERASQAVFALPTGLAPSSPAVDPSSSEHGLGDFSERADRLVARLQRLQRLPLGAPAASDASARPLSAR